MKPSLGTESIPRPSSQGSEIISAEEERLWELKTVDHCKDSVSSRHNRGAAHRKSQCLCRHVQGLRKFKPGNNLSTERGRGGGQDAVPLLAEDPW